MIRWPLALALVLGILGPLAGQSAEQKKQSVAYLKSLQTKGGSFISAEGQDKPSLRATSSALRAIKYFGGEVDNREGCSAFVAKCFDADSGGFKDHPDANSPEVAVTAVGLMAVVELKMPLEKYREPAIKYLTKNAKTFEEIRIAAAGLEAVKASPDEVQGWLKEVTARRNDDGTYGQGTGQARQTGSAVVVEMRLGAKPEKADAIAKSLRGGQRDDGGFGKEDVKASDLETSYRVMRAFWMMKERPDANRLREFVAKCRNDDGGYGVGPGQKSTVSGTYYASIILYWLDKE